MKYIKLGTRTIFLLMLFSCLSEVKKDKQDKIDSKSVLKRISSIDKRIDAVLVESGGGATVANGHKVYIVIHGKDIADSDTPIFIADYTRGIDIKWTANNLLSIEYAKARIFSFTNFWHAEQLDDWAYIVEIKLENISAEGRALR